MKTAKWIGSWTQEKHAVELRYSAGRDTWPGWELRLKRGYWIGDDRNREYIGRGIEDVKHFVANVSRVGVLVGDSDRGYTVQ